MAAALRHWPRIVVTLVPVLLALLHVSGTLHWLALDRLDSFIYDVRLRATLPGTPDPRIVIVDIDEASLSAHGQWPWGRDKLATLVNELVKRQQVAALGFDVVFAEADSRPGNNDARFAQALAGRPVALGYYFSRNPAPLTTGKLPPPVLPPAAIPVRSTDPPPWNDFGANIPLLANAATAAGFMNAATDAGDDGLLRAVPLLIRYEGRSAESGYYESLGLALYRLASGRPAVAPRLVVEKPDALHLQSLLLGSGAQRVRVPLDTSARMLVPFRGPGGPRGGSFRYVSAAQVLKGALAPGTLRNAIVLVGTSAPGLQDLLPTPVSATFPGVEVHANVISALLDGRLLEVPDYALGYDFVVMLAAGLILAFGLSLLSVPRALLLAAGVTGAVLGLNLWLYMHFHLVMPLAATLVMIVLTLIVNMSWGDFVEARARRNLLRLFGSYVPPEVVDRMIERPRHYTMRAESKELTVMFCDIRGFTALAEQMAPVDLQALLNSVFNSLTEIISRHGGTVDKYMGDCVMAFWGAPIAMPAHATLATQAALDMVQSIPALNAAHSASGWPRIGIGIGLNTGLMSVGDMGSALRRSYTVIGDAVNLAARLEGLGPHYGVSIVASAATREQAASLPWMELDRVRVKGKAQAVTVFTPLHGNTSMAASTPAALNPWQQMLTAYRAQRPDEAFAWLAPLLAQDGENVLYQLYAQRIASMQRDPPRPEWDGASQFQSK